MKKLILIIALLLSSLFINAQDKSYDIVTDSTNKFSLDVNVKTEKSVVEVREKISDLTKVLDNVNQTLVQQNETDEKTVIVLDKISNVLDNLRKPTTLETLNNEYGINKNAIDSMINKQIRLSAWVAIIILGIGLILLPKLLEVTRRSANGSYKMARIGLYIAILVVLFLAMNQGLSAMVNSDYIHLKHLVEIIQ